MSEQDDSARKGQILAAMMKASHPASLFAWGNTRSLKELPEAAGVPVRDKLQVGFPPFPCFYL